MGEKYLLLLMWAYFPVSVAVAWVTGGILARGSADGGFGLGHIARRDEKPATYWMYVTLNSVVAIVVFVATDGFGTIPGLSMLMGLSRAAAGF